MDSEQSTEKCSMCEGGKITPNSRLAFTGAIGEICQFCNGTGEKNSAAESIIKNHTCQCAIHDRKNCPLCGTKCHHSTPNKSKILIAPSM